MICPLLGMKSGPLMVFSLSLETNRYLHAESADHADYTESSVKKWKKSVRSVKSVYERVKILDFEKTMRVRLRVVVIL